MRNDRWLFAGISIGILALTLAFPLPALAAFGSNPLDNALAVVVDLLTGSTARLLAIIAVAGVGLSMLAGRLSAFVALTVIAGIAVIFGSAAIVDMFR